MEELGLNRDTVRTIIDEARRFHAKEGVTIPEEPLSPADNWAMQALADQAGDPVADEFRSTVESLEIPEQARLVALMWLGRADYALEEWNQAVADAREEWNGRTAEYLIGTPLVADYLEAGLEQFDAAGQEAGRVFTASGDSRS